MGAYKKMQQENYERGFDEVGKYVCSQCVGSELLKKVIEGNLQKNYCNYCEENNNSAPVELILEKIMEKINSNYAPFADMFGSAGYDSFSPCDTKDVLNDLNGELELSECLLGDVVTSIGNSNNEWLPINYNQN